MNKIKKSGKIMLLIFAVGLIGTIITGILGFDIKIAPYMVKMTFDTPATAAMGGDNIYILDLYSTRISCVSDGKILWRITGGDEREGEFYKAQAITASDDGTLYVQNIRYDSQGIFVLSEEIRSYSPDGEYLGTLYSYTYENGKGPTTNGNICDISVRGGKLYVTRRCDEGLSVTTIGAAGNTSEVIYKSENARGSAINTAIDAGGTLYYTAKDGGIRAINASGDNAVYYPDDFAENTIGTIPYSIDIASDGSIVFTDIGRRRIMRLNDAGGADIIVGNNGDDGDGINATPLRYPLSCSGNGMITTDSVSIEVFDTLGACTDNFTDAFLPAADIILLITGWLSIVMLACGAVYIIALVLRRVLGGKNASMARLSVLGTVLVLVSSIMVGAMSISNANDNTDEEFRKNVEYISHLITKQIDGDLLEKINTPADINSEEYASLKQTLNDYIHASEETEYGMYYMVFKKIGGVVVSVLDSDNMYPAVYPMYVSDRFDYVYEDGNYDMMDFIEDAYGIWAGAAGPICDSDGNYVGLLEIGINMYALRSVHNAQTFELILSVAALVVLILFMLSEGVVFINYLDLRKKARESGNKGDFAGSESLLRTLMFLFFTAQAMQDSYIAVLSIKIYEPVFGLPASIGGALPITFEMLMISIFSIVGGHMLEKIPVKRMLIISMGISITGFVISAVSPGFYILMLGKIIMGAGSGLVYTTLYTAVACIPDDRSEGAFSMLNAGMLTGCQCGIVIGAYIYSWFSYHAAYACSAIIGLLVILVSVKLLSSSQYQSNSAVSGEKQEQPRESISTLRFICDRSTWSFLLLSIIPSLLAVAFFEYYFPIFGDSNGLSETRIGQILLVNGLFAIYTGPAITKFMLKRFGARISVMITSLVFAAALLLFTITPSTWTMLLIAMVFGMITGFSYSVQSEYFSRINAVEAYGEGKAMGIYSMFQSISQALAPILIGYMSLSGIIGGTMITAVVVAVAGLGFLTLSVTRKAKTTSRKEDNK